jgi:hypothetical protein
MKVQYVSDLHLEFYDKQNTGTITPSEMLRPSAPYLVLAGDIGIPELKSYSTFLNWCSNHWTKVFLVAGNHEYYNYRCPVKTDMKTKQELLRTLCKGVPNVFFLDCDSVYLPEENVRILGCTLWSEIPDCLHEKVVTYMNDSRQIFKEKDVPFTPWGMSERHQREKQWLNQEIHKCELTNEKCLVVTHYLPSYSLIAEKYQGHFLNACFASDCEDLMRPPVVGWICGHSHTGVKLNLHGVRCSMNPYGYPHEDVETRDRAAIVEI